jgi:hypothetical protein
VKLHHCFYLFSEAKFCLEKFLLLTKNILQYQISFELAFFISKTPEINSSVEYVYGEEKVISILPGKTTFVRKGNELHELWIDGASSCTHVFRFSTFGFTVVTATGAAGHVSTSLWERLPGPADLCGLYVLEKATNLDVLFPKMSKAEAELLTSHWLLRVTVSTDGLYEMVDYLGNGAEKRTSFRMGQEFQLADEDFHVDGVHLITMSGPTALTYVVKDKRTGKTDVWKAEVAEESFIWRLERSGGPPGSLVFRRLADIIGSWKRVTITSTDGYFRGLGITAAGAAEKFEDEMPTSTFSYIGKGVWESKTDSKVAARDPILFR